ncbi:MAG: hypothetical protein JWM27_3968 [Gemmatimonadetes bacterium]|nr:hypothetical protein [Gemmatimonadota bacterium]
MTATRHLRQSFARGFGRALDMGGATRLHGHRIGRFIRSDEAALQADWDAVAGDLASAVREVSGRIVATGSAAPHG